MTYPLCYFDDCTVNDTLDGIKQIECLRYNTKIQLRLSESLYSKALYPKMINLICEIVVKTPTAPDGSFWSFYYDPTEKENIDCNAINLFSMLKSYPKSLIDITNRTLINLSYRFPSFGEDFFVNCDVVNLCFPSKYEDSYDEAEGVFRMLAQMGYLVDNGHRVYSISAEGWKKIDDFRFKQNEIKQGFIAMRFGTVTEDIREGFRQAITESGYVMRAIDEKEHNNQIVPEIFYEIERSKFVVVDVTYPNYGAYYEAGYAQGLGKQVIVCCKKDVFENKEEKYERPHFDISQKSMVIWENIEDLKTRLKKRIEATVK